MRRHLIALIGLVLVAMFGAGALVVAANAVPVAPNDHQVAICHATSSATNPYVIAYPAKWQVVDDGGHATGQGVHPADIIPSFPAGEHGNKSWGSYPGYNWNAVTEEFWANDCAAPSDEPSESPSEEPSEEPSESPTEEPSEEPSEEPTQSPSEEPSEEPTTPVPPKPTKTPNPQTPGSDAPAPADRPVEVPTAVAAGK